MNSSDSDHESPPYRAQPPAGHQVVIMHVTAWDDERIRRAFVQKVFALLAAMLLVVTAMGSLTVFVAPVRKFFLAHWYIGLLAFIPFVVTWCVLVCIRRARRRFPLNICLLAVLTVSMGFVVMSNCVRVSPEYVVLIFGVTTFTCIGTIFFASTSSRLDGCGFICFAALLSVVLYSAGAAVIWWFGYTVVWWNVLLCGIFCVIYISLLAINTREIILGNRGGIQPDEVTMGTLVLFVDIVYIFLCMLGVGGGRQ